MEEEKLESVGCADVVILGSGLAGLAAAVAAEELERTVLVLEQADEVGGSSSKATCGISAAVDEDDVEAFVADTLWSGGGLSDERLVRRLCGSSLDAMRWLGLQLGRVEWRSGHSRARTRRNETGPNFGALVVNAMRARLRTTKIVTGATVQSVSPTRVRYNDRVIEAGAVVFATGLATAETTGLDLCFDAGGALARVDKIHPTFDDESDCKSFATHEAWGLIVDAEGRKFVDELSPRDVIAAKVPAPPLDAPLAEFYVARGALLDESASFASVVPCVHYSIAGIVIDDQARVLSRDSPGRTIPGLFAAGECVAGLHGAHPLEGNSLLDCLVFGRLAGTNAALHAFVAHAQLARHTTSACHRLLRSLFLPLAPTFLV